MKALTSILAGLVLGAVTFTAPAFAADQATIGVAMPTKSSAR